jgi:signal transduction histidine kinase
MIVILRDITERRRAEERLRRQNILLEEIARSERAAHEALKQLESQMVQAEKLAALGRMVAGVAHEVNNPLAFVRNNLTILQRDLGHLRELIELYQEADESLDQSRPELLARIRALAEQMDLAYTLMNVESLATRSTEGLKRIEQIVKDLRDFARLQEAERKEIDLNENIATTVGIARVAARQKQVDIVTDLETLPHIICYPAKLNQVLLNLLTNAIDASSRRGTVTIRTRLDPEGGVTLAVIDTGKGIDPSIRDRIFEPFFTTKQVGQGTGLGLSIAYGIVQLHGGRIEFESEPDRGTQFTVHLPLLSPDPTSERPDGSGKITMS